MAHQQKFRTQFFHGYPTNSLLTNNDQYNTSNSDNSTNTTNTTTTHNTTTNTTDTSSSSNIVPFNLNSGIVPTMQQAVNLDGTVSSSSSQALNNDFHPHPAVQSIQSSLPRHISLPTYTQTSPKLIRASSITNEEYLKNEKRHRNLLNVRITIEFQGDINAMTANWTAKEIENSRRLVSISFKQQFNHLILNFKPIDPNEYVPGTPVISCIYWNQTNKFYVTSVDLITLLEYLVNSKFPVEEKNRIRRNLQSLKPLTVSKSNPKFYQFFQLIMNFQNPKPRHIEKDVKVLSWSTLRDSLQKVLSKYTIDPSIEGNAPPTSMQVPPPPPPSHGAGAVSAPRGASYDLNIPRATPSTSSNSSSLLNQSSISSVVPNHTPLPKSSGGISDGSNSTGSGSSGSAPSRYQFQQPPFQEAYIPYYQYAPPLPGGPTTSLGQHFNYQAPVYNQQGSTAPIPSHVQYQLPTLAPYQDQPPPPLSQGNTQDVTPHQQPQILSASHLNPYPQGLGQPPTNVAQGNSTPQASYNMYYYQ